MADQEEVTGIRAIPAARSGPGEGDAELKAMDVIVTALKPLKEEERRRVLEYVLGRFGAVPIDSAASSLTAAAPSGSGGTGVTSSAASSGAMHDIRSLKDEKVPRSANEMAALVAFYLSEFAPIAERRATITKTDIERYFKSAGFRLPADASFTLVNAKNAGYLDNAGSGHYKLNPVGYNLVAHRMGERKNTEPRRTSKKKVKRTVNKKANGRRKR